MRRPSDAFCFFFSITQVTVCFSLVVASYFPVIMSMQAIENMRKKQGRMLKCSHII